MTGEDIIKVRDQLASQRSMMTQHWRECADVYMPFATIDQETIDIYAADKMHDSTGRQALLTMADGLASILFPREEESFEWVPPMALKDDETAKRAFREASDIGQAFLQSSNIWEEIGEAFIELPGYGTCALFCGDLDDRGELYFSSQSIGTYYIAEDAYGRVNCFYRDLRLTAEQAAQEFGREKLPQEVLTALGQAAGKTEKFSFVSGVGRKSQAANKDAPDSQQGEYYNTVVFEKTKEIVFEKSFPEFPFAVCRYRKFGKCVWGWGPGAVAKGTANQLSAMNDVADIIVERLGLPSVAAPSGMEGELDLGPGGVSYYDANDPNSRQPIYEIGGKGDLSALQWLMDRRTNEVNEAFHVPMFKIFSMRAMDRQPLTATEANAIEREKLAQFSPVYGRIISEMIDVIQERLFVVLLRAGMFGDIFDALVDPKSGRRLIPKPGVLYKNKIVLAMQSQQNRSFVQTMAIAAPLFEISPQLLDNYDLDEIARSLPRNEGMPEAWIRKKDAVDKIRAERAKAQAQAEALAQAEAASQVAKNLGSAPPEMRGAA